jgi:hypothetical protein
MLGAQRAEFILETKRDDHACPYPAITAVNTIALHWGTPEMDARSVLEDTLKAITEPPPMRATGCAHSTAGCLPGPVDAPAVPYRRAKTGDYQWDYVLFLPSFWKFSPAAWSLCVLFRQNRLKHKPFLLSTRTSSIRLWRMFWGLKTLRMPTSKKPGSASLGSLSRTEEPPTAA